MSAYRDAFSISSTDAGSRLELAKALLAQGQGVVLLDGFLALRPDGDQILCEVITNAGDPDRCRAAVAEAREVLAAASIFEVVSRKRTVWLAVEDYGSGTIETWRAG